MSLSEERAIGCDYVTVESLAEVGGLTLREVRLLAAMVLTHRDSAYSDRGTDLDRGVHELTGKEPWWWNPQDRV